MADFREYQGIDFSSMFLVHYGVGHDKGGNSGRYKWGSGDRPYQRTSMEGKAARNEEKLKKWQSKAVKESDARHDRSIARAQKKLNKRSAAYEKAIESGNERKINRQENKLKKAEAREAAELLAKTLERDEIMRMTLSDVKKENRLVAMNSVGAALTTIGTLSLAQAGLSPIFFVYIPDPTLVRSMSRLKRSKEREKQEQKMTNTELEYDKEYDEAVRNLSKGSASDKAWAEVMKVDRNRNSYKNEEDYDRDRRKAVDEYERLVKKDKQR